MDHPQFLKKVISLYVSYKADFTIFRLTCNFLIQYQKFSHFFLSPINLHYYQNHILQQQTLTLMTTGKVIRCKEYFRFATEYIFPKKEKYTILFSNSILEMLSSSHKFKTVNNIKICIFFVILFPSLYRFQASNKLTFNLHLKLKLNFQKIIAIQLKNKQTTTKHSSKQLYFYCTGKC